MICVYAPDSTDFSGNGLGPVSPLSCTVTETLNGEWELTLEHPLDETGKWRRLVEGCILRAPVPAAMTPGITMITQATPEVRREIWKVRTNGSRLMLRSGTGTRYKIIGKYKNGTEVVLLEKTTSSWYRMLAPDGKQGYMSASWLQYVRTEVTPGQGEAVNEVVEARQLRDQPFRIYRVVPELDKITVYARHVFYDFMDNMIRKYEPSATTTGANVAQGIASGCLSEHDFTFYSDLDSTAEEVKFENINPVDAILGDGGLVEKYGGELARDWFDVFLVKRVGSDTDVQIRQGKNLLGISYDVDLTDVVTRIMPTGEDKDGNILYLPEVYIDSPNIGNYPHPKWIHLAVSEAKEVTEGDERKSKDQCYAEMRNAVQAEYDKGCDLPTVTLKVDFINCAETVEYQAYKPLQNIFLGDSVRVIAPRIGVEVSMRMTQYTYDCLQRRYTAMTLGTVADTLEGNTISARQLPSGIITGSKLAINSVGIGALQKRLRWLLADPDGGDPDGAHRDGGHHLGADRGGRHPDGAHRRRADHCRANCRRHHHGGADRAGDHYGGVHRRRDDHRGADQGRLHHRCQDRTGDHYIRADRGSSHRHGANCRPCRDRRQNRQRDHHLSQDRGGGNSICTHSGCCHYQGENRSAGCG